MAPFGYCRTHAHWDIKWAIKNSSSRRLEVLRPGGAQLALLPPPRTWEALTLAQLKGLAYSSEDLLDSDEQPVRGRAGGVGGCVRVCM